MNDRLVISFPPHIRGESSVEKIMWQVVLALSPAILASILFFGINAIRVILLSVIFCVGIEYLIQKFLLKQEVTITDGSATVTGILLAFNLPAGIPWWQLLIGALVAIGIAKMAFGGLGKNPFNPALVARAFMIASFPVQMTSWTKPVEKFWSLGPDAISAATPLSVLKNGVRHGETIVQIADKIPSYWHMFIGNMCGCIGEVSTLAILIGGIYLISRKVITYHIPVYFLLSLAFFTGILWLLNPLKFEDPLFHLLTGGVMLAAWFMATDMVTSPMSVKGKIVFAVGGGLICTAIRIAGAYPEGCSYAILIMNAFVPLIDKYFKPKRYGEEVNYG